MSVYCDIISLLEEWEMDFELGVGCWERGGWFGLRFI
jgi:hypothetical protein